MLLPTCILTTLGRLAGARELRDAAVQETPSFRDGTLLRGNGEAGKYFTDLRPTSAITTAHIQDLLSRPFDLGPEGRVRSRKGRLRSAVDSNQIQGDSSSQTQKGESDQGEVESDLQRLRTRSEGTVRVRSRRTGQIQERSSQTGSGFESDPREQFESDREGRVRSRKGRVRSAVQVRSRRASHIQKSSNYISQIKQMAMESA